MSFIESFCINWEELISKAFCDWLSIFRTSEVTPWARFFLKRFMFFNWYDFFRRCHLQNLKSVHHLITSEFTPAQIMGFVVSSICKECLYIDRLPPLLTDDRVYLSMFIFCFSYTLFAWRVWLPFLHLFECLTIVRHRCIILWFVYERILLRFVYFVMNSHLFYYGTAIKSTLIPFVLSRDHNITRWRICCFCSSLAVQKRLKTEMSAGSCVK